MSDSLYALVRTGNPPDRAIRTPDDSADAEALPIGLDQYETVPLMWTTGPLGPTVPWLVGLPVIPLNSPVPPVISPTAEKNCGKPEGLRAGQMTPDPDVVIDPVAPTNVKSIGSRVEHGVVVKSQVNSTLTVTGPMRLV